MEVNRDSEGQVDDVNRSQLEEKVKRLFSSVEDLIWNEVVPRHLPRPDMLGYLADRQIRQSELHRLAELIRSNWPGIGSIHVNQHRESFQLTVCTADENMNQRTRLDDYRHFKSWLIEEFPGFADFEVFVQGPTKWSPWTRRCTEIFPVVREPECVNKTSPEIG